MPATEALIEKINALPDQRVAEVEDFVDFIRLRDHDRALVRSTAESSAPAFAAVWDNPEDPPTMSFDATYHSAME